MKKSLRIMEIVMGSLNCAAIAIVAVFGAYFAFTIISVLFFGGTLSDARDLDFEIAQEIGGALKVVGTFRSDVHSFGDSVTVYYKPESSEAEYLVGESRYYGREFDKEKTILKVGEHFMFSAGNSPRGDKFFASKNLKQWKEFNFSTKELQLAIDKSKLGKKSSITSGDICLYSNLRNAAWFRWVGEGPKPGPQRVVFSFGIDWDAGDVIYEEILEIVDGQFSISCRSVPELEIGSGF